MKWFFIYLIPGRIGIWKCWFLGERGKPEYLEKNLSQQGREPTTNSTHMPAPGFEPRPHWWKASATLAPKQLIVLQCHLQYA